jgi:Tfp pilus assembly protein PilF
LASILCLAHPTIGEAATWCHLETPRFAVVSQLNERDTLAWAKEFFEFTQALQDLSHIDEQLRPQLTLVLFAREKDFRGYTPLLPDGSRRNVSGFFAKRDRWAIAGLCGQLDDQDTRHTLFHEGVHWFMSPMEQYVPLWMEEGLAEVFSTFSVEKGKARWGEAIGDHVLLLNTTSPMPIAKLVLVSPGDRLLNEDSRVGVFYAQSWALVHYLLFGEHAGSRTVLNDYLKALQQPGMPDEIFRNIFGVDYAGMDRRFADYLRDGKYFINNRPVTNENAAWPVEKASPETVEIALGKLALVAADIKNAETHARAAIAAAPESALGYEVLGRVCEESQRGEAAHTAYERAAALHSRDAHTYFALANAIVSARATFDRQVSGLPPEEARAAASYFERAINLNPRFQPAYQGLAGIIELAEKWSDEDRKFLELGAQLFPKDGILKLGLAVLAKKGGDAADARRRVEAVLADATAQPADVRNYAARLTAAWDEETEASAIQTLAETSRFAEALNRLDVALRQPDLSATTRQQLQLQRPLLAAFAKFAEARTALDEQRWADARQLLKSVLEMGGPLALRNQAQRSLAELDRRKLRAD